MYHPIPDQEQHPDDYFLADIKGNFLEDEVHDLSTPKQTHATVGLYLQKKKDEKERKTSSQRSNLNFSSDPKKTNHYLERLLMENKGFWVDKPTLTAPLINKLKEMYSVQLPKKDPNKGQGIFYRPDYLELDYLIKLGKAGLLYPEEEATDSEEEVKPDETMCLPLRKKKYKICNPCKTKREKSKTGETQKDEKETILLPFKKIPSGCQCNYYGVHNQPPSVWDCPYQDEVDMIRKHEMNKYLKPFKSELSCKNYKEHPPVFFTPVAPGAKRTFPHLTLSNL